jgi:hypothetical protein
MSLHPRGRALSPRTCLLHTFCEGTCTINLQSTHTDSNTVAPAYQKGILNLNAAKSENPLVFEYFLIYSDYKSIGT